MNPIVVDPIPDANGHWTLRFDDGSENGDISVEPVATVYEREIADYIVETINARVRTIVP